MIKEDYSRRNFLKLVGGVGTSFALGSFTTIACANATASGKESATIDDKGKNTAVFTPNAFVKIDPDGTITVTISRSDMGQGVRTSLAMLVAEELDADWHKVHVQQAFGDSSTFGGQGTGGSSSIRSMHGQLRQVGAGARMMLVAAAAKGWNVDPGTCKTENGRVIHPATGKSVSYGDLTSVASGVEVPASGSIKLKDPAEFKILGKATTRVDNPAVVTGKAMYGIDVKVPGMKYAVIARKPAFGALVKSFDDAAAKAVPGVVSIVQVGNGVAVVADNTWAALKGREALKVEWDMGPNTSVSSDTIRNGLKAAVIAHPDVPAGSKVVEASYEFPYLAHATMEPMNAVADVRGDKCTVWAGSQTPDSARGQVAGQLKAPLENVTINVMLLGGGFGRRLANDYITEAVEISSLVKQPVKLVWSREDDMKHDNYRPMTQHSLRGAVDGNGVPVAWSHQIVQAGGRAGGNKFGGAHINYDIPGAGMLRSGAPAPVPVGAWRSVEHTQIDVADECFYDELAHAAGKDPFEFRRDHIKSDRLKKVLETAAKNAGWGSAMPKGSGRGIACFDGYGSVVAHVIEVTVDGDKIKVDRVVCAVDCGMAVNPKGVEAQIQGACSDALSMALRAAITIDKGAVVQNSWYDYEWMTIDAMPKMEITILQSGGDPGGMGEVGFPSVAPALANAIFAATGKRVRKFPIKVSELV